MCLLEFMEFCLHCSEALDDETFPDVRIDSLVFLCELFFTAKDGKVRQVAKMELAGVCLFCSFRGL